MAKCLHRDDDFIKERTLRAMGLRRKGYLGGGIPAILPLSSSAPPLKRISSGQFQLVQGNIILTPGLMVLQKIIAAIFILGPEILYI